MKFKPDRTILSAAKKYISYITEIADYSTPVINIPIKVIGANQVLPIVFNIEARFTVDSLTFNPPMFNFGNVWDYGASRINAFIENHSILPQKFCFINLPGEVEVETDQGCGIVLPGERYPVSIVYKPSVTNEEVEGILSC